MVGCRVRQGSVSWGWVPMLGWVCVGLGGVGQGKVWVVLCVVVWCGAVQDFVVHGVVFGGYRDYSSFELGLKLMGSEL